ncbi:hypothetical protein BN946_scf184766.g14 [Trametes cinnabarina]|uniref:Uncharacterized protein n=1 Tax=Pycnoporus cinnabarinus TaxID=5643 RepID=A0A060SBW0_PYCCI|nr:hypothetical protein BN946_scf184766.g14 [Trametes cinnabarina]
MAGENSTGARPAGVNGQNLGAYSQPEQPDQAPVGNQPLDLSTPAARVVENEARSRRNDERRVRRETGEASVEEDEPLLELVDGEPERQRDDRQSEGNTPGPETRGRSERSLEVIWEALQQEGEARTRALEVIGAALGAPTTSREKDKDAAKVRALLTEAPVVEGAGCQLQRNRLDQRLLNVISLGFHLPLTLCTNDAIDAVRRKPALLQCKSQHDAWGNKISVVDVTAGWPDEYEMSSEDWRDAWTNFSQMLPEVLSPEGVLRMRQHYDYLVQHPYFRVCFTAILRFDIHIRHDYFWGKICKPFEVGLPDYVAALMQEQNVVALEASSSFLGRAQESRSSSSSRGPRFQPYDRPPDRGHGAVQGGGFGGDQRRGFNDGSGGRPFRTGRSSVSAGPLCLICAKSGHRADRCTQTRLPNDTPVVSGACERDRIITTYRAEAFEAELRRWDLWECFGSLPTRLRCGFPIGNMEPLTRTFTPDNHKGGLEHMDFIKAYVDEQVGLGHMSGPFSRGQVERLLGSHFRSSPLSVVEKPNAPGKWRLIQNCSFKDEHGVSVNDMIDSEDFPTVWGTAAEVADIIANAPEGAQFATLDIDAAFRRIPIYPPHKAYLVIQCEPGAFYIDHVCPFGVSSGTGLQGSVMDPFVAFLDARGWGPNRKWVDDLLNGRYPVAGSADSGWVYAHGVQDIFGLAASLGVPLHQEKWTPHAFEAEYAGFAWDAANRTVTLAEKKRLKYLGRVEDALRSAKGGASRMGLLAVQKLNGTLSHCAFVYPHGRTFLSGLYAFAASFRSEFAPRYPPKSIVSDLGWWRDVLSKPSVKRTLRPRKTLTDLDVWVDASSSWGIGLVMGDTWDAWKWAVPYEEWHSNGRDIGWAEMVAIELALRALEETGVHDADVLIRSDNEGVVHALRRGRSRNFQVNLSIRRTEALCMALNIVVQPVYVNTKINRADPVSRGIPDPSLRRSKARFTLPQEVSIYLDHV